MAKNLEMGPQDYWLVLRRRKWLILTSVVLWVGLAVALNSLTDPVYRARTQIVIEREPTRSVLTGEPLGSSSPQSDNLALYTAAALIDNRRLLADVVDSLRTQGIALRDPPSRNPLQPYLARLWKRLGNGQAPPSGGERAVLKRRIDWLESKISVEPVRNTRLVNIFVEHWDPAVAERIGNTLAEVFMAHQAQQLSTGASSLVAYLSAQIEQVRSKVERAEMQLSGASQAGYFELEARLKQLTETVGEQRRELLRSDAALAKARQIYKSEHPKLVALESEHQTIQGNIDSGEQEMRQINAELQKYTTLQADLKTNQDLYNLLQVKLQEAQLNGQRENPLVHVVEPAAAEPGVVRPRKALNIVIGLVIGLMAGIGLGFLRETFRRTIRTPQDVEEQLQLPVLGLIPKGA